MVREGGEDANSASGEEDRVELGSVRVAQAPCSVVAPAPSYSTPPQVGGLSESAVPAEGLQQRRERQPPVTEGDAVSASPYLQRRPRRPRRNGLLRRWRRTAKKKWRLMFYSGAAALLFAGVLLAGTALLENWGRIGGRSSTDSITGELAPKTQVPAYFEGRKVPKIFEEYADMHNKLMLEPEVGQYILYEIPSNTTLAQAMLGLTSTYLLGLVSDRALLVQWTQSYMAPGPMDVGGDAWSSSTQYENTTDAEARRHSSLEAVLVDPGFWWSWDRFVQRWVGQNDLPAAQLQWVDVDLSQEYEALTCTNLKSWRRSDQFVKVSNIDYFAPILTVNYWSREILSSIKQEELFQNASNWLLRPVPSVMNAVRRFRDRYFVNNFVIGVEMSLFASGTTEWGTMSTAQQQHFFKEARDASFRATQSLPPGQSVVVLVVTDDEEALRARFKSLGRDPLGAVGVIAITGPQGLGTERIHSEVQEAWLLGLADVCIVSPGSAVGILGHARTGIKPTVILDSSTAIRSESNQPCLSSAHRVKETTCYHQNMLKRLIIDSDTPCISGSGETRKASPPLGGTRARHLGHNIGARSPWYEEAAALVHPWNTLAAPGASSRQDL